MKTTIVTDQEIQSIVDEIEAISDDLSFVESDLGSISGEDDTDSIAIDISAAHSSVRDVLIELESINNRFETEANDIDLDSIAHDDAILSLYYEGSRSALLSALHSLEAIKGHDENSKNNNKTEIPVSASDIKTIRNVLISAIALHGADNRNSLLISALVELKKFIELTYQRFKELSAIGTAGGVLYLIVEAFRLAIEKLGKVIEMAGSISI